MPLTRSLSKGCPTNPDYNLLIGPKRICFVSFRFRIPSLVVPQKVFFSSCMKASVAESGDACVPELVTL